MGTGSQTGLAAAANIGVGRRSARLEPITGNSRRAGTYLEEDLVSGRSTKAINLRLASHSTSTVSNTSIYT
jgi:hypothetical protein